MPIPDQYLCPITSEPMRDAVSTPCRHIFEAEAISFWICSRHPSATCPCCRAPLSMEELKPVSSAFQNAIDRNPDVIAERAKAKVPQSASTAPAAPVSSTQRQSFLDRASSALRNRASSALGNEQQRNSDSSDDDIPPPPRGPRLLLIEAGDMLATAPFAEAVVERARNFNYDLYLARRFYQAADPRLHASFQEYIRRDITLAEQVQKDLKQVVRSLFDVWLNSMKRLQIIQEADLLKHKYEEILSLSINPPIQRLRLNF